MATKKKTKPATTAKPFTQPMTIAGQVAKPAPKSTVFTQPMTIAGQTKTPTPKSTVFTEPMTISGAGGSTVENYREGQKTPELTLLSTYTDPDTGDIIDVMSDGSEVVRKKGASKDLGLTSDEVLTQTKEYTASLLAQMTKEEKTAERLSAFNILKMEFDQYGLGSLVTDIKDLLINDTPTSEFGLRLRGSDAYKTRFKANETRIAAGLSSLSPAEYVALEDQYQSVMRNYGMPASYYTKDTTGKQVGFEKFIAGDVSATELEDRISTAQNRVINTNPEVSAALKQFYPDIQGGDILAYVLDPSQGLENIKRKVSAAEIGGAAIQSGLNRGQSPADIAKYAARSAELAAAGITKAQAQEGFQTVAEIAPRGGQLAAIYNQDPYTQQTAETEIFGLAGSAEAKKKREKLTALETASFSGQSGRGALARERAGSI